MIIGPLRWWHIEEIISIENELFGPEQWTAAMFWNELANSHYYVVALDDGGKVLGYGGLAVAPDGAWIQNIGVRRDAQRQGIGRAMLETLLARAEKRRATTVMLEVAVDNEAAQRLYDAYGFEGVGVRKGYYQPTNTDALVMRKDLERGS